MLGSGALLPLHVTCKGAGALGWRSQDLTSRGHEPERNLLPAATYVISVLARRARGTTGTHGTLEVGRGETVRIPRTRTKGGGRVRLAGGGEGGPQVCVCEVL